MSTIRKKLSLIFTSCIIVFLVISFLLNTPLAVPSLVSFLGGEEDLSSFAETIQQTYKSEVRFKDSYVNLNGLFARLSGRQEYNGVARLNNGMLTHLSIPKQDMSQYANGIIAFQRFLAEAGIEYTYIQCPNKTDIKNTLVPTGVVNYANYNADLLAEALKHGGVDMIDFRKAISGTPELVEQYFYNTDHHWNTEAAFYAYTEIVAMLKEKFPEAEFDENALLDTAWEKEVYQDWFLGSHGRRVGRYFGGLDDFVLYTPKFETDMYMAIPRNKIFYKGSFEEVIVRQEFLDRPAYFDESTYCAYIGADYQLVHHINYHAKNDLKVLIIKDSFALAPQAFLSTQVRELDVIDPRYYTDTSLAEYVAMSSPDIVITMVHPLSLYNAKISYSDTGVESGRVHLTQTKETLLGTLASIEVAAAEDRPFQNCILTDRIREDGSNLLKKGYKYTLSISGAEVRRGDCEGFTVAVFDQNAGTLLSSYAFDFDNRDSEGRYTWTFVTPEEGDTKLKLLIYAGLHGSTQGNTLCFEGVTLSRWSE